MISRPHRTGSRLESGRAPRRGARRLSGDERTAGDQGDGQVLERPLRTGAATEASLTRSTEGDTRMTAWTSDELDKIAGAEELEIAPVRLDGTLRNRVTIWVVRVRDDLYVRSYKGSTAAWYRGAQVRHEGRIWAGGCREGRHLRGRGPRPQRPDRCRVPCQVPPLCGRHHRKYRRR